MFILDIRSSCSSTGTTENFLLLFITKVDSVVLLLFESAKCKWNDSLDFIVGKLDVILKYEHVGFLDSILINK